MLVLLLSDDISIVDVKVPWIDASGRSLGNSSFCSSTEALRGDFDDGLAVILIGMKVDTNVDSLEAFIDISFGSLVYMPDCVDN